VKIDAVADRCQEILAALSQVIVGKGEVLEQLLAGVLANGHILIEDYPGLAKTLIARLVIFYQATSPAASSTISARRASSSGGGRSSPTCSSPTRSTGPRPRRRARSWRPCRNPR
jgi:hypothetical protein